MKLEEILFEIKALHATLVGEGDADLIVMLARNLQTWSSGHNANNDRPAFALRAAINSIQTYRRACREELGKIYVESIPVRKAIMAGDGGGRFYWRLATRDGAYLSIVKEGLIGTIHVARRKALEHYIDGLEITELVPPDIDPQGPDERQRNFAKQQEPGLTVRQREKKN